MKVKVYIYILTDVNGEKCVGVTDDESGKISLGGTGNDDEYHEFDDCRGYHAARLAKDYGMTVECIEKVIEL